MRPRRGSRSVASAWVRPVLTDAQRVDALGESRGRLLFCVFIICSTLLLVLKNKNSFFFSLLKKMLPVNK